MIIGRARVLSPGVFFYVLFQYNKDENRSNLKETIVISEIVNYMTHKYIFWKI